MKADIEDGYTKVANVLLESICQCDLSGRQFRVFLAVVRLTYGYNGKKMDWLAASQIKDIAQYNGDETNIRADIRVLVKRKILRKEGRKIGPNPHVSEWQFDKKQIKNDPKTDQKQSVKQIEINPKTDGNQSGFSDLEETETDRNQSADRLKSIRGQIENDPLNRLKSIPTKEKRNLSKEIYPKKDIAHTDDSKRSPKKPNTAKPKKLTVGITEMQTEFPDLTDQTAKDWLAVRKAKRAPLTETAWNDAVNEIRKSGLCAEQAIKIAAIRSWQGIKSEWLHNHLKSNQPDAGSQSGALHQFDNVDYDYGVTDDGKF